MAITIKEALQGLLVSIDKNMRGTNSNGGFPIPGNTEGWIRKAEQALADEDGWEKLEKIDVNNIIESPSWRNVRDASRDAIKKLGGNLAARDTLSWESYYTLSILAALMMDGPKGDVKLLK